MPRGATPRPLDMSSTKVSARHRLTVPERDTLRLCRGPEQVIRNRDSAGASGSRPLLEDLTQGGRREDGKWPTASGQCPAGTLRVAWPCPEDAPLR